MVLGKLRRSSPILSETIDDNTLNPLLNSLFPNNVGNSSPSIVPEVEWMDELDVTSYEVTEYIKKRPARNAAPGPDNFKATVWKKVPNVILGHVANLFTLCLKRGYFPEIWRRAILVLIPKGPRGVSGEIKARPICLLDELGKTFERVIAQRINFWLENNEEHSLSENQYGFRRARSTVDALLRVRELTREMVGRGGYAIAMGLDISNAFNSVPWGTILAALEHKEIPVYLRAIVASYLSRRSIVYRNMEGCTMCARVFRRGRF